MLPAIGTHEELSLDPGHATYAGPSLFQMPEENFNNFDACPPKREWERVPESWDEDGYSSYCDLKVVMII